MGAKDDFHLSARPLMANADGSRSQVTLENGQASPKPSSHDGAKLGWIVSAIFIVADMVGGGVVAMPVAFVQSGIYYGVFFMISIALIFLYTGYQLGVVWNTMRKRWPEYHEHCRKPFPEIAKRSMGPGAKKFTSLLVNVTLFGICVVYLLLSSNIAYYFAEHFLSQYVEMSYCQTIVVLALLLSPFTYLKSPADFWPVIVLAMVTTTMAVCMIVGGVARDAEGCYKAASYPEVRSDQVILSLGTFLFAFSGHYVFPTIQNDMREPKNFTRSIILGFTLVVCLYMPVSAISFLVYGDSLQHSVIYSVQTNWLQLGANSMIAVHCILTLVIVINPINQEVEEFFKVPHHFGVGRFVVRTCALLSVVFVGLTVPDFFPVMNVVGASTIPLGCVVLPSFFYMYIQAAEEYEWKRDEIPSFRDVLYRTKKSTLFINIVVLSVAVFGGILGTYQAILGMREAAFSAPCYLQPFITQNVTVNTNAGGHGFAQQCCGASRNVTTFLDSCSSAI